MKAGWLIAALVLLLLLLSGALGSVLLVSAKVIGWILVVLISGVLVWKVLAMPFRSKHARRAEELRLQIIKRRSLGYDTAELEDRLTELSKRPD